MVRNKGQGKPYITYISICLLDTFFVIFLSSTDFFQSDYLTFSKNSVRGTIKVSSRLDPDQAQHSVGPDLDPNCKDYQQLTEGNFQRFKPNNMHK